MALEQDVILWGLRYLVWFSMLAKIVTILIINFRKTLRWGSISEQKKRDGGAFKGRKGLAPINPNQRSLYTTYSSTKSLTSCLDHKSYAWKPFLRSRLQEEVRKSWEE